MKNIIATALILSCTVFSASSALETTATAKDVKEANPEINITTSNAVVTAAITKVNRDLMAVLKCNNKNMFYKPKDSTADSDGCVGASISTTTKTETVNLANVLFDSYPGGKSNGKGFIGTSTREIDLSGMVAAGAKAISVNANRSSFASCNNAVAMNVANVNTNIGTQTFTCHYDNSPNRSHNFKWSYNGSTKKLTVTAQSSQVKVKANAEKAKLTNIKASYTITKTVLKIGDGK